MEIAVYGSGCKRCHELLENTKKAVEQSGVDAKIDYVTDMAAIASKGIMSMPALAIDDKVVSTGKVLDASAIGKLIAGAQPSSASDSCSCGGNCC